MCILIQMQGVRPKVPSPVKTKTRIQPPVRYGNIAIAYLIKKRINNCCKNSQQFFCYTETFKLICNCE